MHVDEGRYIIMSQLFSSDIINMGRAGHHNAEFMMQRGCVHYDIVRHYNAGEAVQHYNVMRFGNYNVVSIIIRSL